MTKLSAVLRCVAYSTSSNVALQHNDNGGDHSFIMYDAQVVNNAADTYGKEKDTNPDVMTNFVATLKESIIGILSMELATDGCGYNYEISIVAAKKGYGPLLYDTALSVAKEDGMGVIPDRDGVTGPAQSVWEYYIRNRGDTVHERLPSTCPESDAHNPNMEHSFKIKSPINYSIMKSLHSDVMETAKQAGIPNRLFRSYLNAHATSYFTKKYTST